MTAAARLRAAAPDPADGLRAHCEALRVHADRLRAAAGELEQQGPPAAPFRAEVAALAERCSTAADGLALAAARLRER
ncbi:hypothetical protein C0216_13665 [Streptomyces globosus]|uniref:Uncharacterized protein n=1 Tax=Streptomyces globosus TaxID=68209 RepID=A0A344U0E0_9ACTN|nr:hypothetical protein [Streptomyces globosus]AXE24361.1 hypothetical protein C0216_13665 [Streptomyces globosus]